MNTFYCRLVISGRATCEIAQRLTASHTNPPVLTMENSRQARGCRPASRVNHAYSNEEASMLGPLHLSNPTPPNSHYPDTIIEETSKFGGGANTRQNAYFIKCLRFRAT